jgi:hypothetical protein
MYAQTERVQDAVSPSTGGCFLLNGIRNVERGNKYWESAPY